ncbi:stage V sporulation protein AD [Psychrobacillus sp. FSL K6-2684]|uniref:stage V sporulation protein AD n=1 Tax=unclassified Psychrobacillus TaxID=2636677 RepID=UPI00124541CE|nr:stage V sporulation protein AD [Psychrobacillus sp. AK 1817]QEY20401.1 stage V sporulation protein AD [Psychrobacillus sp. AK 1817]
MVNTGGTISFTQRPSIASAGVVVGPVEKVSPFAESFDEILTTEKEKNETYEQAASRFIEKACSIAVSKVHEKMDNIDLFIGGDLVNQMSPSSFAARKLAIPYFGVFSACASSMEATIIGCLLLETGNSKNILAGASSHHPTVERQFRYPLEYGAQKPKTAQWTVTAAAFALLQSNAKNAPYISHATMGRVVDGKQTNPLHMGAAMAPAARDTIERHLKNTNSKMSDYDLIMTGDLGKIGLSILKEMFQDENSGVILQDAGAQYYGDDQFFNAGASGPGCSASVFFSHIYSQLKKGTFKRVLLIATGALLSPLTYQQGETIPCIAHAIECRMEKKG